MDQNVRNRLWEIAGREQVYEQEPMSRHTTFRIGGPADFFVAPADMEALAGLVSFCRQEEIPFYVMGNGSNLLVGDKGYRGVIIQVYKNLNRIEITENRIKAQAGAMLSAVARKALEHSLTGFEFASGIPGTLGGAVVMNAGAYGGEMKDVIRQVRVLTPEGDFAQIPGHEMEFGYRTSAAAKRGYIVLEAELELSPGDADPGPDGGTEGAAGFQAAPGSSQRRQHVQAAGRVFCRQTDYGRGTAGLLCGRGPSFRKTLRLCGEYGGRYRGPGPGTDGRGKPACERTIRRAAGAGSEDVGRVLRCALLS